MDELMVSVWYPMDKEEYATRIDEPGRNPSEIRCCFGTVTKAGRALQEPPPLEV